MPETNGLPQPQNGDRLFMCRRRPQIRPALGVWPTWAKAYKAAADLLIESDLGGGDSAAKIYPIVYLYRHSLELELKSVVVLALVAADIDDVGEQVREIFRTHDLMKLLGFFADVLNAGAARHGEGEFGLPTCLAAAVGPFMACVEEMSQLDPNSDFLRFPVNKHFRQAARPLDGLDLANLKFTMSKLANFLMVTRSGLEDQIDLRDLYASWNSDQFLTTEELQSMTVGEPGDILGGSLEDEF